MKPSPYNSHISCPLITPTIVPPRHNMTHLLQVATLHLCHSLAADDAVPWRCITLLPSIIDTPANQEAMGRYIHDDWTPPERIAEALQGWLGDADTRPPRQVLFKMNLRYT